MATSLFDTPLARYTMTMVDLWGKMAWAQSAAMIASGNHGIVSFVLCQ